MGLNPRAWEFDPAQHEDADFSEDVLREGTNLWNHLGQQLTALALGLERRLQTGLIEQDGEHKIVQREVSGVLVALQFAVFEALRYVEYNERSVITTVTDPRAVAAVAAARLRREGG
jgi:hypothetical protein